MAAWINNELFKTPEKENALADQSVKSHWNCGGEIHAQSQQNWRLPATVEYHCVITVLLLSYYWVMTDLWLSYCVFRYLIKNNDCPNCNDKKKKIIWQLECCASIILYHKVYFKKKCWGSFLFLLLILLSNYCSPVQLYIHSLTRCWKMARVNQQFQMTSRKTSTVEPLSGAATAWPLLPTRRRGGKNAIHFTEHGKRISPQRESAIVLPSSCVAENSQTNCNMKNSTKRFPRRCST